MPHVVRTWNLFHGNADPPQRRGYLREMVELVTRDTPAAVCLQEVPVWALGRLDEWSGMRCFRAVAHSPIVPGPLGMWITSLNVGLFRSGVTGQANAILVPRTAVAHDLGGRRISDPDRERRVAHAIRIEGLGVVANLHASNDHARPEVPRAELDRARYFAEKLAASDERIVLAGDFNLRDPVLEGYSPGADGIDHILVRGGRPGPPVVWDRALTTLDGVVLSDHPPVEVTLD